MFFSASCLRLFNKLGSNRLILLLAICALLVRSLFAHGYMPNYGQTDSGFSITFCSAQGGSEYHPLTLPSSPTDTAPHHSDCLFGFCSVLATLAGNVPTKALTRQVSSAVFVQITAAYRHYVAGPPLSARGPPHFTQT